MRDAGRNPCLSSSWCKTNQISAKSQPHEISRELPDAQRKVQRHWHVRDTDFIAPIHRFHVASILFSITKRLLRAYLMSDSRGPASSLFLSVFPVASRATCTLAVYFIAWPGSLNIPTNPQPISQRSFPLRLNHVWTI